MNDTPRTDAYVAMLIAEGADSDSLEHFARDIERELNAAKARVAELEERCKRMEDALNNVELVMQRPASNHRMMQIAAPARQVINIVRQVKEYKQ